MSLSAAAEAPPGGIHWRRSLAWLAFLGPFFFLSYGASNHLAALRGIDLSIAFDWERHIPFLPWTIVPYWSIDLFYGLAFLLPRSRLEVDRLALRLLTAQLVSVACFLLFPLRFAFVRPEADGLFGALFDALAGFDLPYNQAPSLHIGLLVILWARFAASTRGPWRLVVDAWAVLIAVSVLTTWQHHFIDVPTGALVGFLCLWLWPDAGAPPLAGFRATTCPARKRLALRYAAGAIAVAIIAFAIGGWALWLLWPAVSLLLVAVNYRAAGAEGFQKRDGRLSPASRALLAPYLAGAWLNSRWWTRRAPEPHEIADGVALGRMPSARDAGGGRFDALYDLAAELDAPSGFHAYAGMPLLDLVPPSPEALRSAAARIEALRRHGRVLVCCALGYSRSACAVAAWLLDSGRAEDVAMAVARIRAARPQIVLTAGHLAALEAAFGNRDA